MKQLRQIKPVNNWDSILFTCFIVLRDTFAVIGILLTIVLMLDVLGVLSP